MSSDPIKKVANCRYDVMLGMPWHVKRKPAVDYGKGKLKAGNISLPSSRDFEKCIKVQNFGSKEIPTFSSKKIIMKILLCIKWDI